MTVLDGTAARDVVAAGRRLSDRNQRVHIATLDSVIDGSGDSSIQRWPDRAARGVELGSQELLEIGLVPGGKEAHGRIPGVAPGVAIRQRLGERREVARL